MRPDPENPAGEFLLRFYRKRTASFLANIYKAGITGEPEDIHKARLDAKKVIAFLDLLGILAPKNKACPDYGKLFKKLFKSSGKIREIHVNLLLLDKSGLSPEDIAPFREELLHQEKERTADFMAVIRDFDEHELARAEIQIGRTVKKITPARLRGKTERFIRKKSEMIRGLAAKGSDEKALHKVRRHLKELSAMISLVSRVHPVGILDYSTGGLDRMEVRIGAWHDNVVLAASLEDFLLSSGSSMTESRRLPLLDLRKRLLDDNYSEMTRLLVDIRTESFFPDQNMAKQD